jgi:hypothetical protein
MGSEITDLKKKSFWSTLKPELTTTSEKWTPPAYKGYHFKGPISSYIKHLFLWTRTTCQQRSKFLGRKGGRCIQVWLYLKILTDCTVWEIKRYYKTDRKIYAVKTQKKIYSNTKTVFLGNFNWPVTKTWNKVMIIRLTVCYLEEKKFKFKLSKFQCKCSFCQKKRHPTVLA